MATYLVDNLTELPESGDLGWGTVLNAAILSIDDRFTYDSNTLEFSLASDVVGSSLTSVGTLSSLTVSGNVSITGNLIVTGSTTTVTSTTVSVTDPIFTLGGNTAPASDDNKDRGIEFRWHNGSSAKIGFFGYDDSTGKFTFIPDATNSSEVFSGTKGELDANVEWSNILSKPDPTITVELTGDVTGNASATLTDLASGTVTLNATISANSVELGTDTTGNYMVDLSAGTGISITHTPSEGSTGTIALDASLNDLTNVSVSSPSDGQFLKYVSASSDWQPADIPIVNNLDDVGDVTITTVTSGDFLKWDGAAWVNDAIELGTDTTGNYVSDVSGGTGVTVTHTPGEGSTATIAIGQDVANTASVVFSSVTATTLYVDSIEIDTTGATSGQVLAYDGAKFAPTTIATGASGASMTVAATAPSTPSEGDLWFKSDTEVLYIYFSSSWAQIGSTSIDGGTPSTSF